MDVEQFRKAGYQAIDRICDYHHSLKERPVAPSVEPGYLRDAIPGSVPERGEDFQVIADDYQRLIVPGLTHWQSPSFFGYFPAACTFEGMLGELYATSTCNPAFNWACSPACTELESIVMDWVAKMFGLCEDFWCSSGVGGGVIQTTASDCALTAIVAARSNYISKYPNRKLEDLVIYTTTQTHSLGAKAGVVLGLKVRSLEVSASDRFAVRGETLRKAIKEDLARGQYPFIMIGTVGTTSSGAIDYIDELGEVLKEYPDIWFHVDAAWAGAVFACPEFREVARLRHVNEYADSLCVNLQKWCLINLDTSALWVKDRKRLTEALDITPEFLRTKQGDEGNVIEYRNWHLALGRRFRSLKIWFVLRSFGIEGFRAHVRKGVELNRYFVSLVEDSENFSLVTEPSFALSVFRLTPRGPDGQAVSEEQLNELNKAFYSRVSARRDIFLTQTDLNGTFCIRMAIGAVRTEREHIDQAFALFQEEANATINEWMNTIRETKIEVSGIDQSPPPRASRESKRSKAKKSLDGSIFRGKLMNIKIFGRISRSFGRV